MNRKKLIAFSLLVFSCCTIQAQTLFTYGNRAVSRDEFLKAFNKNNTEAKPSAAHYREYLELYTRFKIKVQAALDMKLDTLPSQKAELRSFRDQVANSYMNDEASINVLIDEAMARAAKDIRVSHIYIQVPTNATADQLKKAEAKITLANNRLLKGEEFSKVAAELSEDPEVQSNKGDIGYITVFTLPYDLENLAYNTPVGKISKVHRSSIGYHIFKNTGERKSPGKIKVAQILLAFPPDATPVQKQQLALRADSIYRVLQAGGDFKQMALAFSNDNISYMNGGELQEFGTGRYDPVFESAAFALKSDGELSKPFTTNFGYHILKRVQWNPVKTDKKDKASIESFRQLVSQNDRMEVSKKILEKKVLQQIGYKKYPVNAKAFSMLTDTILLTGNVPGRSSFKGTEPLIGYAKQTLTVQDYVTYLQAVRGVQNVTGGKSNSQLFEQFVETTGLEYYKQHLEEYNKEFAFQLQEFRDGNLLFEVMQRRIWDQAAVDTVGLRKYYDEHKSNYWWEASADALIFTASNDSIAESIKKKLQASYANWRQLVEQSDGTLQGDSGRFELGQLPVVDRTVFSQGLITATVKSDVDNSASFCYIIKMYNNREPRSFNDARGFVINDYQNWMEDKWIAELKKKYPVKVNELEFKKIAN